MIKVHDGFGGDTIVLCKECIDNIRNKCLTHEDTMPRDCNLIKYYLDMARNELIDGYQVFIKYTDIKPIFFLAKNGVVLEEYTHPKALIGEILLRKNNPEWFD